MGNFDRILEIFADSFNQKEDNETKKEQRKKFFDRLQRLLRSNFLERAEAHKSQPCKRACLVPTHKQHSTVGHRPTL